MSKVEHIPWDDSYRIGHPMIDKQHMHLFELADKLYNVLDADLSCEASHIETLLQECVEYVLFHFSNEEGLMDEVEFEGETRKAHLQQHQEFNQYVSQLLGEFSTEKKIDLVQLYSFLANWLVKHITVEDKKLGEHIRMFLYGE